jgi:hypothetical protein
MRARGTQVTDIAVLVVAADDGVMPQTREAVRHAKAAGCAVIVALTKCDRLGARPDHVEAELLAAGVNVESGGGDVQVVRTAAPVGMGLQELEEAILLQAEVLDVTAPVQGFATGTVVESRLDKAMGPVATVVISSGTLRVGDPLVVGKEHGRVRQMELPDGTEVVEATPGTLLLSAPLPCLLSLCMCTCTCHTLQPCSQLPCLALPCLLSLCTCTCTCHTLQPCSQLPCLALPCLLSLCTCTCTCHTLQPCSQLPCLALTCLASSLSARARVRAILCSLALSSLALPCLLSLCTCTCTCHALQPCQALLSTLTEKSCPSHQRRSGTFQEASDVVCE